jgi:hypothetical protein
MESIAGTAIVITNLKTGSVPILFSLYSIHAPSMMSLSISFLFSAGQILRIHIKDRTVKTVRLLDSSLIILLFSILFYIYFLHFAVNKRLQYISLNTAHSRQKEQKPLKPVRFQELFGATGQI